MKAICIHTRGGSEGPPSQMHRNRIEKKCFCMSRRSQHSSSATHYAIDQTPI
jgi:hypothetical protein